MRVDNSLIFQRNIDRNSETCDLTRSSHCHKKTQGPWGREDGVPLSRSTESCIKFSSTASLRVVGLASGRRMVVRGSIVGNKRKRMIVSSSSLLDISDH